MALVHLEMEQILVFMNGYANVNIISHSWGTTLTYDLQNNSTLETHNWVTMGSPMKATTGKPVGVTGNWINYYSLKDPIVHMDVFPPFPSNDFFIQQALIGVAKGLAGVAGDGLTGDKQVDFNHPPYDMGKQLLLEHTAYWNDDNVINALRMDLR